MIQDTLNSVEVYYPTEHRGLGYMMCGCNRSFQNKSNNQKKAHRNSKSLVQQKVSETDTPIDTAPKQNSQSSQIVQQASDIWLKKQKSSYQKQQDKHNQVDGAHQNIDNGGIRKDAKKQSIIDCYANLNLNDSQAGYQSNSRQRSTFEDSAWQLQHETYQNINHSSTNNSSIIQQLSTPPTGIDSQSKLQKDSSNSNKPIFTSFYKNDKPKNNQIWKQACYQLQNLQPFNQNSLSTKALDLQTPNHCLISLQLPRINEVEIQAFSRKNYRQSRLDSYRSQDADKKVWSSLYTDYKSIADLNNEIQKENSLSQIESLDENNNHNHNHNNSSNHNHYNNSSNNYNNSSNYNNNLQNQDQQNNYTDTLSKDQNSSKGLLQQSKSPSKSLNDMQIQYLQQIQQKQQDQQQLHQQLSSDIVALQKILNKTIEQQKTLKKLNVQVSQVIPNLNNNQLATVKQQGLSSKNQQIASLQWNMSKFESQQDDMWLSLYDTGKNILKADYLIPKITTQEQSFTEITNNRNSYVDPQIRFTKQQSHLAEQLSASQSQFLVENFPSAKIIQNLEDDITKTSSSAGPRSQLQSKMSYIKTLQDTKKFNKIKAEGQNSFRLHNPDLISQNLIQSNDQNVDVQNASPESARIKSYSNRLTEIISGSYFTQSESANNSNQKSTKTHENPSKSSQESNQGLSHINVNSSQYNNDVQKAAVNEISHRSSKSFSQLQKRVSMDRKYSNGRMSQAGHYATNSYEDTLDVVSIRGSDGGIETFEVKRKGSPVKQNLFKNDSINKEICRPNLKLDLKSLLNSQSTSDYQSVKNAASQRSQFTDCNSKLNVSHLRQGCQTDRTISDKLGTYMQNYDENLEQESPKALCSHSGFSSSSNKVQFEDELFESSIKKNQQMGFLSKQGGSQRLSSISENTKASSKSLNTLVNTVSVCESEDINKQNDTQLSNTIDPQELKSYIINQDQAFDKEQAINKDLCQENQKPINSFQEQNQQKNQGNITKDFVMDSKHLNGFVHISKGGSQKFEGEDIASRNFSLKPYSLICSKSTGQAGYTVDSAIRQKQHLHSSIADALEYAAQALNGPGTKKKLLSESTIFRGNNQESNLDSQSNSSYHQSDSGNDTPPQTPQHQHKCSSDNIHELGDLTCLIQDFKKLNAQNLSILEQLVSDKQLNSIIDNGVNSEVLNNAELRLRSNNNSDMTSKDTNSSI